MRPAPPPPPEPVVRSQHETVSNASSLAAAPPRMFHYDPAAIARGPKETAPFGFTPDAPPSIGFQGSRDGVSGANLLGGAIISVPPPPSKPQIHPSASSAPIRVGGSVQMAKLIRMVKPEYPAIAKTARISGVVHLIGIIARDGTIRNLQLVSGHPLLARAALEAVAQWIYKPTLLNGEPVEVIAPIEVSFTLGQ